MVGSAEAPRPEFADALKPAGKVVNSSTARVNVPVRSGADGLGGTRLGPVLACVCVGPGLGAGGVGLPLMELLGATVAVSPTIVAARS